MKNQHLLTRISLLQSHIEHLELFGPVLNIAGVTLFDLAPVLDDVKIELEKLPDQSVMRDAFESFVKNNMELSLKLREDNSNIYMFTGTQKAWVDWKMAHEKINTIS